MLNTQGSTETLSFQQISKTAYSHGLEDIYRLETVDISTVKAIEEPKAAVAAPINRWVPHQDAQIKFSFGNAFSDAIAPFVLREPIQMLQLSKRVEQHLLAQEIKLIKHLIPTYAEAGRWMKDLGQGHIDEIENKLQKYLEGTSLQQGKSIDFASWLKTFTRGVTPKKGAALLERFALPPLIPLTSAELWEWHHLSEEKKQQWTKEALQEFQVDAKQAQAQEDVQQMTDVFIKPWLEKRFGLATQAELQERLLYLSSTNTHTEQILHWLSAVYFNRTFPLAHFLEPLENNALYTLDKARSEDYHIIVKLACTYFYTPRVHYFLQPLTLWIAREAARMWHSFSLPHIEKVLRLSPRFRVRKSFCGQLAVRLNPLFQ